MTVESQTSKMAPQAMNGVAVNFAFSFRALVEIPEGILAIITDTTTDTDTTLIYNDGGVDGYTVAIDADGIGGSITVNDARSADYVITVYREYDLTQLSNYADYNAFPADTVEDDYDLGTMIDQQLQEVLDRTLTLPITVTGVSTVLPVPEANAAIGWDPTATFLVNNPANLNQVSVDVAASPDYIGATSGDGVLRTGSGISYADGGDFVTLNVNAGAVDHDSLLNYVADQHIAHSGVVLTAGTGLTGGGDITANRTFDVSADYAVITANDGAAGATVTAVNLTTLTDTSNADALHTHASITDDRVKVDAAATADYIGAASGDGVLRTSTGLSYTDGGDFVTIAVDNVPVSALDDGIDGELITWDAAGAPAVVATGTVNQVLTSNGPGAAPTFQNAGAGFADPMTTRGDIIIRDNTNTTARLGIGANTFVLTSDGVDISWAAAAGGGASVALDNLAGVAINTSLISDLDNTDDLGSAAIGWASLYLSDAGGAPATNGEITYNTANSRFEFYENGGVTFLSAGGGGSLDDAYNGGTTITVDNGPVTLTAPDAANNVVLTINQNDTGSAKAVLINQTANNEALEINGIGTTNEGLVQFYTSSSTTGPILTLWTDSQTSGKALDATNTNSTFTGNIIDVNITHASASGAGIDVNNAGTGFAINISESKGVGVRIVTSSTTEASIATSNASLTTGSAISLSHAGLTSGNYINTDSTAKLTAAGVWTDAVSTFDTKTNVSELSLISENVDKLKAMKLYRFQKKIEVYDTDVEASEDENKTIKKRKYKNTKKNNNARYYEGLILDELTTPAELALQDDQGEYLGLAASDGVNFLLKVCKEQQTIIDNLESRLSILEGA